MNAQTMLLLVRREFWEHRAFVIAPAIVIAILIGTAIFGLGDFADMAHHIPNDAEWQEHRGAILGGVLAFLGVPFAIVMTIVIIFYLLDSLYADRKDRSVLFWKSLPLSDTTTVLSKVATAVVVLPLLTLATVLVTSVLVAFISSVRLSGVEQLDIWSTVWQPGVWLRVYSLMLYALIVCMLWYLPIVAWLLLASAWARRAVILWAALPPLLLMFIEERIFDTNHFFQVIAHRLIGWTWTAFDRDAVTRHAITIDGDRIPWPDRGWDLIDPAGFLASPGLWAGLAVAGLLLWATILVRRRRSEV